MKQQVYSINEIFGPTIQGEGMLAGMPTTFIRFNGCDFRCSWCDSLDAVLPERIKTFQKLMTISDIVERVHGLDKNTSNLVTLSGGNPCVIKNMLPLIQTLQDAGYETAVETQGSIFQEWLWHCNYVTLSPKPPSSKMETDYEVLDKCIYRRGNGQICLKVVVFDPTDLEYAADMHMRYPHMPFFIQVGTSGKGFDKKMTDAPDLQQMVNDYQKVASWILTDQRFAGARVLPQLHLYLFGHGRGV